MKQSSLKFILMAAGLLSLGWVRPVHADFDSWYEKIKIYGDMRYRFENIELDKTNERDRQRIRMRLNFEVTPDDYWKAKVRLSTGNTDPISTNQTLGGDTAVYDQRSWIGLDAATLEYKALFDNLTLIGGKMDNPFISVGKSEMIWDADYTPEGIAGKAKLEMAEEANLFANGGGFWIQEQSADFDPMVYAGQFGLNGKVMDIKYVVGGSYYLYKDTRDQKTFVNNSSGTGNSTYVDSKGNTRYAFNYKIAEAFVDLNMNVGLPLEVYYQVVKNADDQVASRNTGWTAGFVLNKAKKAMDWEFGYFARKMDKDAVVGAYCDSDFNGGGTDAIGNVFSLAYMVTDGVKLQVKHFNNQRFADLDLKRLGYHRTQVDVSMGF